MVLNASLARSRQLSFSRRTKIQSQRRHDMNAHLDCAVITHTITSLVLLLVSPTSFAIEQYKQPLRKQPETQ